MIEPGASFDPVPNMENNQWGDEINGNKIKTIQFIQAH
jgi:hypothetical protein